jgi:protein-tyrosine phosphatase
VVVLPDGRRVRGRGLRRPAPDGVAPEFGLYVTGHDPGPFAWEHRWIKWPDFRLPTSRDDALDGLREAHRRAREERVELACGGGVGRTGTAMAVLAMLSGVAPEDAVDWVRAHYEPRAVETPWQRRWVRLLAASDLGP